MLDVVRIYTHCVMQRRTQRDGLWHRPHGLCMGCVGCVWAVYGLYLTCVWTLGLCIDCVWAVYGLCCTLTQQVPSGYVRIHISPACCTGTRALTHEPCMPYQDTARPTHSPHIPHTQSTHSPSTAHPQFVHSLYMHSPQTAHTHPKHSPYTTHMQPMHTPSPIFSQPTQPIHSR